MRVESVDKVERSTLAVDCTEADFITFETALYQILHGTTTSEPLRMVQQVQGQTEARRTMRPKINSNDFGVFWN